jgi:hypothetical protein
MLISSRATRMMAGFLPTCTKELNDKVASIPIVLLRKVLASRECTGSGAYTAFSNVFLSVRANSDLVILTLLF